MVVKPREKHPRWGGRKLRQRLVDLDRRKVPSASTITSILCRHGLLSELEGAGQANAFQRFERASPNELWQMDFKGHFALVGGGRCHPLTVLDDHSRDSIGIRACENEQGVTVMHELVGMFRQYGLPVQMLMDDGSPWGGMKVDSHGRWSHRGWFVWGFRCATFGRISAITREGLVFPSHLEGGGIA